MSGRQGGPWPGGGRQLLTRDRLRPWCRTAVWTPNGRVKRGETRGSCWCRAVGGLHASRWPRLEEMVKASRLWCGQNPSRSLCGWKTPDTGSRSDTTSAQTPSSLRQTSPAHPATHTQASSSPSHPPRACGELMATPRPVHASPGASTQPPPLPAPSRTACPSPTCGPSATLPQGCVWPGTQNLPVIRA